MYRIPSPIWYCSKISSLGSVNFPIQTLFYKTYIEISLYRWIYLTQKNNSTECILHSIPPFVRNYTDFLSIWLSFWKPISWRRKKMNRSIFNSTNKFVYNWHGHIFNCLVKEGFTSTVAVELARRHRSLHFSVRVKDAFLTRVVMVEKP